MKIGIVGLPNVGKSTLFKALTKKEIDIQNYPFCTIEPNMGVVTVPDDRLAKLTELSHSAKTIPAIVEFFDIAGLVKGASSGEGLGNKFLTHIRETDAIAHMVRIFEDENIIHVESAVDPLRDIETITLELILADLETVKKRAANVERDTKRGDKIAIMEHAVLTRLIPWLEAGNIAAKFLTDEKETEFIKSLHLISSKPVIYVLNKKAGGKNLDDLNDPRWTRLKNFLETQKDLFVKLDANLEMEVGAFEQKEREEYRSASGLKPDENLDTLIRTGYALLGLITYFTTGEDETRAWTIKKNSTAPQAGRAIHSDFEEKFIKADIISYDDFIKAGSMAEARKLGLLRIEGKEYIVKDGDIIEFKI